MTVIVLTMTDIVLTMTDNVLFGEVWGRDEKREEQHVVCGVCAVCSMRYAVCGVRLECYG